MQAFVALLQACEALDASGTAPPAVIAALQAYGQWFAAIAPTGLDWPTYLQQQVLWDDNPFTQAAQAQTLSQMNPALLAAAAQDLQTWDQVAQISWEEVCKLLQAVANLPEALPLWQIPGADQNPPLAAALLLGSDAPISDRLRNLAAYHRQQGAGQMLRYRAFRWSQGQLQGIVSPDPIQLSDLAGYDDPKAQLITNTERLIQGLPALNVLLYGSRGSGKSSLVKALLNAYGDRGLRLIEVAKADLYALPQIVESLSPLPQKFILFVDDLSFEADDEAFKALKVVLEGSLTARPANVVVYATSNRRHLIREFHDDRPRPRDADEIHPWDTVQEKLSFSDRFGLTLTFEAADQDTYLQIVRHLAAQANLNLDPETLSFQARQWATRHNGRSGRTAKQFIDWMIT